MKKDRGFRTLSVMAVLVAVVAISVGYAALSQNLNINGTTTVKQATWNVQFQNLVKPTVANSGLTGAAKETSSSLDVTTLTFAIELTKPGDTATYIWDVHNGGDIDAELSATPTLTGADTAATSHVTYTFTYEDGTKVQAGDALNAGSTKTLKLVVAYDENATTTAAADTALSLSTTLTYVQK